MPCSRSSSRSFGLRVQPYAGRLMATRREYSLDRLATLGERLGPVRPLLAGQPICVYATGSYGRLEGWSGSDVDLFFLYDGDDDAASRGSRSRVSRHASSTRPRRWGSRRSPVTAGT